MSILDATSDNEGALDEAGTWLSTGSGCKLVFGSTGAEVNWLVSDGAEEVESSAKAAGEKGTVIINDVPKIVVTFFARPYCAANIRSGFIKLPLTRP